MKRILVLIPIIITVIFTSCESDNQPEKNNASMVETSFSFTDSLGKEVVLKEKPKSVVALYGSYSETWVLAGGELAGTTQDAIEERDLGLNNVEVIGSVQEPNLEQIIALNPDFVIINSDLPKQLVTGEALEKMQVPVAYFSVDTFDEYLNMLKIFTDITDRADLYQKNGIDVKNQIDEVMSRPHDTYVPSVLLIRASSTEVKARVADNLAGVILDDLGGYNIALKYPSLLNELGVEQVIAEDPNFILVVTLGSDEKARETLRKTIIENKAWSGLYAVKNDKVYVLPKELFHYKPNARWGESYEYLFEILYGG